MDQRIGERRIAPHRDGPIEVRWIREALPANSALGARHRAAGAGGTERGQIAFATGAQRRIARRGAAEIAVLREQESPEGGANVKHVGRFELTDAAVAANMPTRRRLPLSNVIRGCGGVAAGPGRMYARTHEGVLK